MKPDSSLRIILVSIRGRWRMRAPIAAGKVKCEYSNASHFYFGSLSEKCRRHEMFIDEKCIWISRPSELSEMLSIPLNSEENEMFVRASYKHFAATRLFSRRTP